MKQVQFSFQRSRGIVWVCDLSNSSKSLNDKDVVAEMEEFLPRLHWLGMAVVEAAGGTFIKWTGDGFLAWFETPLHREISSRTHSVLEAISQITFTVNVTQLGVHATKKFHVRHGVTFEQDALLTTITEPDDHKSIDIIGRSVVLAFRLSGVSAEFPNLVTDETIMKAVRDSGYKHVSLKKWIPSSDDLLRYFKGERWGTRGLYKSEKNSPRNKSVGTVIRNSKKVLSKIEDPSIELLPPDSFYARITKAMLKGPEWAKAVLDEEVSFIENDLAGPLKRMVDILSKKKT